MLETRTKPVQVTMKSFLTLFIVTCSSIVFFLFWLQTSRKVVPIVHKNMTLGSIVRVFQDPMYPETYTVERLPRSVKFLLLWSDEHLAPFQLFTQGQKAFNKYNCTQINCYVTSDRNFIKDITGYDAIAFNGRNLKSNDLPEKRSPHQKYIYVNMESSDNFPVCDSVFDGYFNWTATYRIKSDFQFGYIMITDKDGNIIGPRTDMKWPTTHPVVSEKLAERLKSKKKAAAWFVTHCKVRSKRSEVVKKLQNELARYGLEVDIYGRCGPLICPRSNETECDKMLERDYFFYLSFENSFAEDYATEKILRALHHNTVPIVYGGANYTRFLPPGSYLDARKMDASTLAATMHRLMLSPKLYRQYFWWKHLYNFDDPLEKFRGICDLCAALNDKQIVSRKTEYLKFRQWWVPNYLSRCGLKSKYNQFFGKIRGFVDIINMFN